MKDYISIPIASLSRSGTYCILRLSGDSMEPQLSSGDTVLANFTRNEPETLRGKVVAAWLPEENGATIKVLTEDESKKFWVLQARNVRYPDKVIPKGLEGFQVAAVEAAWLKF